jgi:hypothetical protein
MEEVARQAEKIKDKPGKACQKLTGDPIKVVRPVRGIVHHRQHHDADAWRVADRPFALCEILDKALPANEAHFWSNLIEDHLARLVDADGKSISPEQLPSDPAQLP